MATKVNIIGLGCAKNMVDTEWMLGILNEQGYHIVEDVQEAEVIIVNTCGFITPAKEEAISVIFEAVQYKEAGKTKAVLVSGCLAQRYGAVLLEEIPEIDGVFGTGYVPQVADLVALALQGERFCQVGAPSFSFCATMPRILTTPSHYAYVKIAEGCSNCCAYCAIPSIRGAYHSRPMDHILQEVSLLLERGVKEVILVAQDTTAYGLKEKGKPQLATLVQRIASLGVPWIRLMYCYPTGFTPELIETMAQNDNVCRYVDLPLQHASPRILQAMNRKGTVEEVETLIHNLRQTIPDIALRTTFMVGFPGENSEDFAMLLDFMKKMRFEKAGVFQFSPEEGTAAEKMPYQVPEREKEERYQKAMLCQQEISKAGNARHLGKVLDVLVEQGPEEKANVYIGRSQWDSPEVDGTVVLQAQGRVLHPGDMVRVKILHTDVYDLHGELIGP